jgi:glycosyltransferase involved in cell wall biosynthesis
LASSHKPHILHVTPYYAPAWSFGGVVSAVTGLASAQAQAGHRVTVLTTDALNHISRSRIARETIDGVQVIRVPNLSHAIRVRFNLSTPFGLPAALREIEADVVHVHELRTVENLLIKHKRPIILSPHGTLSLETGRTTIKRGWDAIFGRSLLCKIDHIVALTEAEAEDARAVWSMIGAPLPKLDIIPNGIAADFAVSGDLRERYNLGDGVVILFLGRLHERKGLQFLIPAFAQVSEQYTDARLLIVGPDEGMLTTLAHMVAQLHLTDRVVFTGMLTGADRGAALASADIFALPAVGEGLSMASLEAMSAGLPLIVTPGCNLPEVEERGAGLLVERSVDGVAQALRALIGDRERRRVMGERGQAWVREVFTWAKIVAQYAAVYEKALLR